MVGIGGTGFTVIVVEAAADVQPFAETVKVYVPLVLTTIDCVVSVVDQVFPVAEEDVSVTEPPVQNAIGPLAVMVGVAGIGLTVTTVGTDEDEQLPLTTVTVYEPPVVTVMDCVVAPFDQVFPVAEEEVKTTEPPAQNVVGPPAVMVGGVPGVTVTVLLLVIWFPQASVTIEYNVTVPAVGNEILVLVPVPTLGVPDALKLQL